MTLILQISFAEKIKAEERVTFQKSFSSMADFRDVVFVLPAARRNKGVFPSFLTVIVVEPATLTKRLLVNRLVPKKGAIFSLIYFFKTFCIYYIPHNYVITQAMPHAIPQTHSSFYPHPSHLCKLPFIWRISLETKMSPIITQLLAFLGTLFVWTIEILQA